MGIAQLAIAYCSALVDDTGLRASYFPGFNFNGSLSSQPERDQVINPLVSRVIGTGLASQPNPTDVHTSSTT